MERIKRIAGHFLPSGGGKAKVAVLGAAGGIGQPLALLLKQNPHISELSLYDVANTAGVACDISHISTAVRVRSFTGPGQLGEALTGCALVVIPAGGAGVRMVRHAAACPPPPPACTCTSPALLSRLAMVWVLCQCCSRGLADLPHGSAWQRGAPPPPPHTLPHQRFSVGAP